MPKKKWMIFSESKIKNQELSIENIIFTLLKNRGLENKKDIENFLSPSLEEVTPQSVGIDTNQLKKALDRIQKAMTANEQIIVFGDYDVDGITGSAILWETLHELGAKCLPYIPNRMDEGYGLSEKGITNVLAQVSDLSLIITVDNGIVANKAVDFANEKGIDVIITDHHTQGEQLPSAHTIVHTTNLCGAGVAYLLSKEIKRKNNIIKKDDNHLELAALGTVADLVPLIGANRVIVKEGLKKLQASTRRGLLALYEQAGIKQDTIGVYDIGYKIGPRLNAAGRIESAMDSLRLLCTPSSRRAAELAAKLELTNRERQQLLKEAAEHAILHVHTNDLAKKNILIVAHESYAEGVIGLVAGKLVEEFYLPAIVLSLREKNSKASVRSISGFNIIEFLRLHEEMFVNLGGHPMAAGFTVETTKLPLLQNALEGAINEVLDEKLLVRELKVDCELPFSLLSKTLYQALQQLAPFGMANPEPVFVTKQVTVENTRVLGKEAQHLKLFVSHSGIKLEAIAFGMGELAAALKVGDKIDIAYVLDENTWNGETKLQLKIKDIKSNQL